MSPLPPLLAITNQFITPRQFDEDLTANEGDAGKQLDLWHSYIDWLEQNAPDDGKISGLTETIERCIELYYDRKEFKQDKRLFDIFMKFKRFCDEPAEIFGFMYANSISTLLAKFYIYWSWQYEIKRNVGRAEDLIKLGIKNLATPRESLIEAHTQLQHRIARMYQSGELDDYVDPGTSSNGRETQAQLANCGIRAALQTLKISVSKKTGSKVATKRIGAAIDQANVGGLKSQTKTVNGVRVAKTITKAKISNRPIEIYSENSEDDGLERLLPKIPTSQRIQLVGRSGCENGVPVTGKVTTNKNK